MFEFQTVAIRPVEEKDLNNLLILRSDPDVWMNLGTIEMINYPQETQWFQEVLQNKTSKYFVLFSKRVDFIGLVRMDEIDHINRSIRIGGDILPKYHNQGYGTKMYALLKKYCFDYLNMQRMWLLVLETNTVAIGLYKKSGFREEGRQRKAIYRDGKYIDYIMMSSLKDEYKKE